jgi:predicted dinucleotide-binding enzyme
MAIVNKISRLQAFDAGPLSVSCMVESLTPLLLNIARYNKMKDVGIRFL